MTMKLSGYASLLITVCLSVILCLCAKAQKTNIKGRVVHKHNERPLTGASVQVKGSHRGTTTNNHGRFALQANPGHDSLQITHVGFKSRLVAVKNTDKLIVYLEPRQVQLEDVTIQGDTLEKISTFDAPARINVPRRDVPITMEGLSSKSMAQRQDDNLQDAMQHATGVRPINRYGGFLTFRMRGFNDFVMMVDNVRDERHNLSSSAPFSNLASVKRIDVIRGPASAMYGHSALGGIINIVRNQPANKDQANLSVTHGSFNTQQLQAGAGGAITNKLQYRLDAGMYKTDGWRDYGINRNNVYLALDYNISGQDKLSLRLSANSDFHETDAGLPVTDDGELAGGLGSSTRFDHPSSFLKYTKYGGQIRYQHEFTDALVLSNRFSTSFDDIDYFASEGLTYNATRDSVSRTFHLYFNHETIPVQNQLQLSWHTQTGSIAHKFIGGYTFNYLDRQTYRGNSNTSPAYSEPMSVQSPQVNRGTATYEEDEIDGTREIVNGFYLQDWIDVSDKLKLMGNIRLDVFNGTYYNDSVNTDRELIRKGERNHNNAAAFTYRGGFVYRFYKDTRFYGSYGTYFKPSRNMIRGELFDPVTGRQAEIGLRWALKDKLSLNLAGYSIRKQNMLVRTGVQNNQLIYKQVGKAHSRGIEFNARGRLLQSLTFTAGYSYNDAWFGEQGEQEELEGNRLAFAPQNMANCWGHYRFHKGLLKGLGIGIGGRYVGENYSDESNEYVLPAYALLNSALSYSYKHWSVSIKLNNITNEQYFADAILNNQFFPGAPLNYKLNFSWKL